MRRIWSCLFGFLGVVGAGSPAVSSQSEQEISSICDAAAQIGADAHGVPLDVMRAITRTETGRGRGGTLQPWPWTVNMEGKGRWFGTMDEALSYVRGRHGEGARSYDVGCFQINYRWHGDAFDSIEAMFDPVQNARYAARFLAALKAEGGDWVSAAGRYHSRTRVFAEKYKKRFTRIRAGLGPLPEKTPVLDARRQTVLPATVAVAAPFFEQHLASTAAPRRDLSGTDAGGSGGLGGVFLSVFPSGKALTAGQEAGQEAGRGLFTSGSSSQ